MKLTLEDIANHSGDEGEPAIRLTRTEILSQVVGEDGKLEDVSTPAQDRLKRMGLPALHTPEWDVWQAELAALEAEIRGRGIS